MFFSRIWLINAILALCVVFLGLKAYGVWIQGDRAVEIPEMEKKPTPKTTKPSKTLYNIKILPESKYDVLMSRNLFRPERTEEIEEVEGQDEEKEKKLSVAEQKNIEQYLSNLTLYGLVITHDSAEALVSYPVSKSALQSKKSAIPKNRRRTIRRISTQENKWVKAGDTLGDFKVVDIKPDRVLLKAGNQSYDLLLYDKENLKKREPAKPKTGPNVVGVSSAPEAATINVKRETVPPAVKKVVPDKNLSKNAPSATQENLKKAIEKRQGR